MFDFILRLLPSLTNKSGCAAKKDMQVGISCLLYGLAVNVDGQLSSMKNT